MPAYAYLLIAIGVIVWFYPFVPAHRGTSGASIVNSRSRWGVLLQFLAFTLLWQGDFLARSFPFWRGGGFVCFFSPAPVLLWAFFRGLSGALRVFLALGAGHQVVWVGPC